MIEAVTCTQIVLVWQVLARIVVVFPVVLSLRVAVAQSYRTVSGQLIRYQKLSLLVPLAAVKVCLSELVLEGEVEPTRAEKLQLCAVRLIEVDPLLVQPDSFPLSKSPLVTPPPLPPEPVTVTVIVAL